MPVAATVSYIRSLLDGLAMPGGVVPMRAYVNPPDPNVDASTPNAYVWPTDFDESRQGKQGGAIPRNTGPGTPSGTKAIEHMIDVFIIWFQANDDPQADTLFFGITDAAMEALRTSPDPADITDPYTGTRTQLFDAGEVMRGRTTITATANQAYNRLDCLLSLTVHELIQA